MYKIELFKDLPNEQSLEAPFEILVQDLTEVVRTIFDIYSGRINYEWNRMIITKQ